MAHEELNKTATRGDLLTTLAMFQEEAAKQITWETGQIEDTANHALMTAAEGAVTRLHRQWIAEAEDIPREGTPTQALPVPAGLEVLVKIEVNREAFRELVGEEPTDERVAKLVRALAATSLVISAVNKA